VSTGENGGRGDLGHAELQLDWDAGNLESRWPAGLDTAYLLIRVAALPSDVTAEGGPGRVLEVAAAEAVHSCKLSLLGMDSVVVEPSPTMLERARRRIGEQGARVALVRGVAETLPFADGTFDRVLIDSAIDHLGKPELSLREMTRVLKPDGRLVISFVNYGGVSVRVSRMLYAAARRLGLASRRSHLPWDSPVPIEHTFECTYPVLRRLCDPLLQLDRVFGVSIGWLVPGWGAVLQRLPQPRALDLLRRLDRFAFRRPGLADFVVSVWRPRPGPARRRRRRWRATTTPCSRTRSSIRERSGLRRSTGSASATHAVAAGADGVARAPRERGVHGRSAARVDRRSAPPRSVSPCGGSRLRR
jgi:SAM-dependent methyltransferase